MASKAERNRLLAQDKSSDTPVHAETRAAWGAPNFGNAKNGMTFCGTLPMNCVISGAEDIPETQDSQLDEAHREFGSLNVWSITPANPNWGNY